MSVDATEGMIEGAALGPELGSRVTAADDETLVGAQVGNKMRSRVGVSGIITGLAEGTELGNGTGLGDGSVNGSVLCSNGGSVGNGATNTDDIIREFDGTDDGSIRGADEGPCVGSPRE
jgi:hypothetical protein